MTVKELINILGQFEEDASIIINDQDAYNYLIDSIEPQFNEITSKQVVLVNIIEEY